MSITPPSISLRQTRSMGRGVFAERNFKQNEVIETCPIVTDCTTSFTGKMIDYIVAGNDPKCNITMLGYCSMYNHNDKPSAAYYWSFTSKFTWLFKQPDTFDIIALQDIKKDSEIFISYGDNYWTTRNKQ